MIIKIHLNPTELLRNDHKTAIHTKRPEKAAELYKAL